MQGLSFGGGAFGWYISSFPVSSTTYIRKTTASDLGGGADFSRELSEGATAGATLTVSVAAGASEDSFGFTPPGVPGTNGGTGDYTVEVEVTTASTDIQLSIAVARVNSAGTQQAISSFTAEQSAGTTGVKIFSLSAIDLGVWASGDRLRVSYRFRNTNAMTAQSVTIRENTVDCEVVAPWPAVFFGAVSSGATTAPPLTFAHTPAGTNRVLLVGVAEWRGDSTSQVSGVTFNGTSLIKISTNIWNTGLITLWELIAPAAVTANVVVSASTTVDLAAVAISVTNADQTDPSRTLATDTATSLSVSTSPTSEVADLVLDFVAHGPGSTISVGAGQTERANNVTAGNAHISASTEPGARPSPSMTWTLTVENRRAAVGVSLKVPAAVAATARRRLLLGVGV